MARMTSAEPKEGRAPRWAFLQESPLIKSKVAMAVGTGEKRMEAKHESNGYREEER